MDPAVVLTVFGVIILAELPDKSLFVSLVLGTRLRPAAVWLGACAAFALHVAIAVLAGRLLTLLPHRIVEAVVVALFAAGALWLLLGSESAEEEWGEREVEGVVASRSWSRGMLTAFGVVFVGEWGDVTQIATANFAARYADPASVAVGAFLALAAVSGLAVTLGRGLVARVDVAVVRRVAGGVLGLLAVLTLVQVLRG